MLRDPVRPDPSAVKPKIQLTQNAKDPAEADKLIDEAVAVDLHSAEALQVIGEMLWARGDLDGAMRLFDQALQKSIPRI